jgi:hypothetical protein
MHKRHNSLGFSAVEAIIIIVVVALLGLGGWLLYQRNQDKRTDTAKTSQESGGKTETPQEKEVAWKTYSHPEGGFTFDYPETWKNEAGDTEYYDSNKFGGVKGTITSPEGKKLDWTYSMTGGSGGDCVPAAGDQLFADGNTCSSRETLSVEKLPALEASADTAVRSMFQDALFITHTKYRSSQAGSLITYQICLDASFADSFPQKGTMMSLVFPCDFWRTGLNMKFVVDGPQGFKSDEAKTAEQIMRTFDSL